jgi:cardiolipin synthase
VGEFLGRASGGAADHPIASAASSAGVERFIHKINSPADDDHWMEYFFVLPILAARERVYVGTPYYVPDGPLTRALVQKAQAGLDVRLLLPSGETDNQMAR